MKIFITLLFIINFSAVHADESIYFSTIPSYVATDQAIASLRAAAIKRKWTVDGEGDNELRIKLDHRGYKARLNFNFSDRDIDLSPARVTKTSERFPVKLTEGRSRHEGQTLYRRTDHQYPQGA